MPKLNQEQYDEIVKKLRILSFQMQENQDYLLGGLTSRNLKSFRNTYVINAQDSLDATYPMYVHFNIISEMIKIVSVKVDFWILNYRAYSKAGASGGGQTSSAGGAQLSSSTTTPSGGGASSGPNNDYTSYQTADDISVNSVSANCYGLFTRTSSGLNASTWTDKISVGTKTLYRLTHKHLMAYHIHTTPDHTHPIHTHTVADHTHTVADHTHTAVYGIFEETNSPKIKFYISENEGISYNDTFFGDYDTDKRDLEITSLLTGAGSKLIKFESTTRARLSVQIEIKLDIKAR